MSLPDLLLEIDEYQKEINEFRPFGPTCLSRIRDFFRVGTVWSSNAIEGFGYTETETKILLEDGLTAGGKSLRDLYAVIGHAEAYDHMFTLLENREIQEDDILTYHSMLRGSLANDAVPGQYRTTKIFVTGTDFVFPSPEKVPEEMASLFKSLKDIRPEYHPLVFAALIHLELVTVHPFSDGNGRVARLAMNTALIQDGFLPAAIPPVLRPSYLNCLKEAQTKKNKCPFMEFICQCEKETQRDFLRMIHKS